ncbi:hypothetical protein C8Q77DRAFT_1132683 [Trametes polyzona]|nr:hypothetical protein C8Q77DRAFT_1132683 [Trametes polyzona]
MTHSFVCAEFDPGESACWLSPSGQRTAANIRTCCFWALRFDLNDIADHTIRDWSRYSPPVLCAVSSQPSPIPLPNASLTLGPKIDLNSGELSTDDGSDEAQLIVEPPIECNPSKLHQPLYLHTVPILRLAWNRRRPIQTVLHTLSADSLERFREIAKHNHGLLRDVWARGKKAHLARLLPHRARSDSDSTEWSLLSGLPEREAITGRLANPRAYAFDFFYEGRLPLCDGPAWIYREIYVYNQVCKDYSWEQSEQTIAWVRDVRANIESRADEGRVAYSGAQIYAPTHGCVQTLLKKNANFRDRLSRVAFLSNVPLESFDSDSDEDDSYTDEDDSYADEDDSYADEDDSDPDEDDSNPDEDAPSDTDRGSGSGWFLEHDLPFAFPYIPLRYKTAPLPNPPSVVVLDMFGVVLDREGAIRRALEQWLVYAYPPLDADEARRLYIEFEALAIREQISSGRATSLPASAHTALSSLADALRIPPPLRRAFLADTLSAILHPPMFDDVEAACEALAKHGVAIVALVPFSFATLAMLRRALPRRVLDLVRFYPRAVPLYEAIPESFFSELLAWCTTPRGSDQGSSASALPARCTAANLDTVVVSGGVGRVFVSLMKAFEDFGFSWGRDPRPQPPVYPTVHVRRPGGVECNVDFYIGEHNPVPSLVVGSLEEMTAALFAAA